LGLPEYRDELIAWVGSNILPHEASVRAWLRRASVSAVESDDIVQEAYSRLVEIKSFRHIANPRAYFLEVARNILFEQLRRSRIVRIETVTEIESLNIPDNEPSQERAAIAKDEIARLRGLIAKLPHRCQQIFVMRKIEGLPQRIIAQRLGITENTVETQIVRGLRIILADWPEGDVRKKKSRRDVHEAGKRHER
jgi:RNA polymerase sigma-70 factor (ECF subfamily)